MSGLAGTGQTLAHAYGEMALATRCCDFTEPGGVITSQNDCRYYCDRTRHQQKFAYRFNEYNQNDTSKAFPRFTDRTITASSGNCYNYTQKSPPTSIPSGFLRYEFYNATFDSHIDIPSQLDAGLGTTYVYQALIPRPMLKASRAVAPAVCMCGAIDLG